MTLKVIRLLRDLIKCKFDESLCDILQDYFRQGTSRSPSATAELLVSTELSPADIRYMMLAYDGNTAIDSLDTANQLAD